MSRLDCGNAILFGINSRHLNRLEVVYGPNCHADPAGRSAVHDKITAAITLAACHRPHTVEQISVEHARQRKPLGL